MTTSQEITRPPTSISQCPLTGDLEIEQAAYAERPLIGMSERPVVSSGARRASQRDGPVAAALLPRAGDHCPAKILSIASAPAVITGRIWWR